MVAQEDRLKSVLMSIKPKYCELIAAGVYGFGGNIRMTIYWFAAAVLNIVVTF